MQPSDEHLMSAIAGGDRRAFETLYHRRKTCVTGVVAGIVRGQEDIADVVQEVFMKAWRTARRYDPARATVATWFSVMAQRLAIDWHRRRGARIRTIAMVESIDPGPSHEEGPAIAEEIADATRRLGRMRERERMAVELSAGRDLTCPQIARMLGIPLGTVKSSMFRIRRGSRSGDVTCSR